ncbi:MAG: hypothetical protein LBT47_07025 [Deltaproteobacteria bacterium]|nr:hypothetical protein [Deltaproteobacteria bacterium]
MTIIDELIKDIKIPNFIPVSQHFKSDSISDIAGEVTKALDKSGIGGQLIVDSEIAVGVGSRGIANLPVLVKSVVEWFKVRQTKPFIVPAMGSHGGATGAGQIKVLSELGVTENTIGCSIRSAMEVVQVDQLDNGLPVYMDALAWKAGRVFLINRIKTHTSFTGKNESGLVKMLTIGLGKQKGADSAHRLGNFQFASIMPAMTRCLIAKKPGILGGLAIVENARDETALIEVIESGNLEEREAELLVYAKSLMPSLPLKNIDLLIIDQIGKNISGAGMDPNITGRHGSSAKFGGPNVTRLVVLGLTPESKGNATGMGPADIISQAMYDSIDFNYTYANVITSTNLSYVRTPMVLATEKMAIQCGLKTSNAPPENIKAIRLKDTLSLERLLMTKAALQELTDLSEIEVMGAEFPLSFNLAGQVDRDIWNF